MKRFFILIITATIWTLSSCGGDKSPIAYIDTDKGLMKVKLFSSTRGHTENFIKLAKEGFYNDLIFHRVINGFMIQGGDPDSRDATPEGRYGGGGPGYQIPAEIGAYHFKGALAAARTQNPEKKSSGSQFYIVHGSPVTDQMLDQIENRSGIKYTEAERALYKEIGGTPQLDHDYTVYGEVIEGLEVVDKIAITPTAPGDRPLEDIKMRVSIVYE